MIPLERGRQPAPKYPFVHIRPQGCAFVVFTCQASEIGGKYTHWLGREGLSAPCVGDMCRYCVKLPKVYMYYAPVMEWWKPSGYTLGEKPFHHGNWRKAILRITEHMNDILDQDLRDSVIQVSRIGKHKNAPLTWTRMEKIPENRRIELSPFDVETTMNKVWGVFAKMIDVEREGDGDDTPPEPDNTVSPAIYTPEAG